MFYADMSVVSLSKWKYFFCIFTKTNNLFPMKKNTIFSVILCFFAMLTFAQERGGCVPPNIPNLNNPEEICAGESASITATSNGETIVWFDAATGGSQLGEGSPFETGPLSETTTFWAEARNFELGDFTTGGARVSPASNSNATVNPGTAPWGLVFNASEGFILNSVDVFLASTNPGTLVIQLKDLDFNIVEEVTVATPPGSSGSPLQFTVDLDFEITPGTGWRLVAAESPVMVREFSSGHPGYPYPIGTVGSVTQGTINDSNTSNPTVYYFFYNWSFTPYDFCASDRASVTVDVNETPLPEGEPVQGFDPGDTLADFDVTGENLTWYQDESGTIEIPDTTPIVEGVTYYVSQTIDDCESELLGVLGQLNLSIGDEVFSSFKFYPNPFVNEIQLSNTTAIEKVSVYSITGQLINSFEVSEREVKLPLHDLAKGIYLLKITSEGFSTTVKVMKK